LGCAIHLWKDLSEDYIIYILHTPKKLFFEKDTNVQSFETTRVPILGLPLGSPEKKCHLDVTPTKIHKGYNNVKLVLEVVLTKFVTPLIFNLH
jgi:hypothetical protein